MNQQSVLNLLPASTGAHLNGLFGGLAKSAISAPNSATTGLFSTQLQARLSAIAAKTAHPVASTSQTAPSSADAQTQALAKKIAGQLQAGVSQADIVSQLAASLANSIATQLGLNGDAARAQLQTAFASALAPPGQTGPPSGSTADQAQTLAQRFAQIASTATRVATTGESGQLNRFVGNILDANSAKETPAPAPTASGTTTANASIAVARTQALASATAQLTVATSAAIASGGDTLLGRVLARSANLAQANQANLAGSETSAKATDPTVASFLKSFESAFAPRAEAAGSLETPSSDGSLATLLAPAPSQTNDAAAFVPGAAPFTIDASTQAAPIAPPLPAHSAPDVSQSAIVDQILRGAFTKNLTQTSSEIRLSLVPENLGDLSVKLTVNTGGTVDAHVIAQTTDVRDALVAGQSQLTKQLADSGLKLTSFTVDVNSGGFAGFTQQQNTSQQRQPSGRHSLFGGIETDESGDEGALFAAPSFGPPLVAGQNLGALNYLV